MDKKPLEVKSYNVEDERRFKDLTARIKALEQWMDDSKDRPDGCTFADLRFLERSNSDMWQRLAALEARCHELEHGAVAAGVQEQIDNLQEQIDNLQERVKALENQRPVKPAPELVRCEVIGCTHTSCGHLAAHWKEPLCSLGCTRFKSVRCIPVPTPVGTDAFRREMTGHMQTLAQAYSWDADSLPVWGGHDYLERLADVACTLRDAYDLARTGEHEAAQEKLEEIEW